MLQETMDICSVTTSTPTPYSPTLFFSTSSSAKHHFSAITSVSFSSKPPPPPSPPPTQPPEPTNNNFNSNSLRRPKTLKSTSTSTPASSPSPKTSKNPLNALLTPPPPPPPLSPPPTPINPYALTSKLWLTSRLSPPRPPPLPQPPPDSKSEETENSEEKAEENGVGTERFRQQGKIFVGNLPNWIKKHEVSEFFRQFGPIKNVILIKGHNETEKNAGFGFVIYGGSTAEKSAVKAVEFDGVEFHGRILTLKLDDGRRLSAKAEERERWVAGEDAEKFKSKWHEEREGSRKAFRKVLETRPENWQAAVTAFERIKKVKKGNLLIV